MRRLVIALLLVLFCFAERNSEAQTIQYVYSAVTHNITTTGGSCGDFQSSCNIIGAGAQYHQISWNVSGTLSACSVRVDSSADGVTWNTGDIIAAQTCTSNGNALSTVHTVNYTRINVTSITPVSTATLTVNLTGYANNPSGSSGGTVTSLTATSPVVATPSTITTTGAFSCPTCTTESGSPVAGNIPKFSTATNLVPSVAADLIALWSSCSGTQYLGADGNCHTAASNPTWDVIQNAAGNLTLANGTNTTTFNQTNATAWTWANTTASAAGAGNTGQSSPIIELCGTFWNGSVSGPLCFTIQDVVGNSGNNPPQTLTIGTVSGTSNVVFSIPQGAGNVTNPQYTFTGATGYGVGLRAGTSIDLDVNGTDVVEAQTTSFEVGSTTPIGWGSTTSPHASGRDTAWSRLAADIGGFGNGSQGDTTGKIKAAGFMSVGTTFTSNGGCSETTLTGGATAGKFTTVGSTSCTIIITMGNSATAPNGWECSAHDLTTVADVANPHLVSSTATTVTIATGTIVSGDVISFGCQGY